MACNCCGFEPITSAGRAEATSARSARRRARSRCERCGAKLPSEETAARYLDKLRVLAGFGLASDAWLLLEPTSEDA